MSKERIHLCIIITPEQRTDITTIFKNWKGMQKRVFSRLVESVIAAMKESPEAVMSAAIEDRLHIILSVIPKAGATDQDTTKIYRGVLDR